MNKESRLTDIGNERRNAVVNTYTKDKNYYNDYDNILKNSRLTKEGKKEREETPHPGYDLEIEEMENVNEYGMDSVKKGNPADGGHTHTIPNSNGSSTAIADQLATYEGGDENDIKQREYLTNINKYSETRAYTESSIDMGTDLDQFIVD